MVRQNYIHRLQSSVRELEQTIAAYSQGIADLRAHLQSAKFQGIDQDGDRKDWIATADVLRWLDGIDGK